MPAGGTMTRKEIDELTDFVKGFGAMGLAWIKIHENEWQSPIAKFLSEEERAGLVAACGLEPGDIVFFAGTGSSNAISHVGIYVGNGQMIHSPNSRSTVSYSDLTSGYWAQHYYGARRVA